MQTTSLPHLPPILDQISPSAEKSTCQKKCDTPTDTMPSSPDTESSQILISLRVCKHCQDSLLNTFNHCLSKQSPATAATEKNTKDDDFLGHPFFLNSINQTDEVEDAKRLNEPPYFKVVRDPTREKNRIFSDQKERIRKEQLIHRDFKKYNFGIGAKLGGGGISESGNLLKQTLQQHKKEILKLKQNLYDKTLEGDFQMENVDRLRLALQKAVKYYAYAEEWQSEESARLQYDVRCLKAEMSSLMAFLINSEEEKRMLTIKIEEINKVIEEKEIKITQEERQRSHLKDKLQSAYKDYLTIADSVKRLEVEAEMGSEEVRNKNEILQRNLDKISKDFEICSKDLSNFQVKIKELEFELDEITAQFTACGEAKRNLEIEKSKYLSDLATTTQNLNSVTQAYNIGQGEISNLELKVINLSETMESIEGSLQNKIQNLSTNLESEKAERKGLEINLKHCKTENEKLLSAVKSLNRAKDQLESTQRIERIRLEKEISTRDDKISELQSFREQEEKVLRKTQEQKEQLLFQVNDLQNSLDREASAVNSLNFELLQLRKHYEETSLALEDNIEKLNQQRLNLTSDKRQLTDKLKAVRAELAKKEDQYAVQGDAFEKFKIEAHEIEARLKSKLSHLNSEHKKLNSEHSILDQKYQVMVDSNATLNIQCSQYAKKQIIIESQNKVFGELIETTTIENVALKSDLEKTTTERNDYKVHLDSVIIKVTELNEKMNRQDSENKAVVADHIANYKKMTKDYNNQSEIVKKLSAVKGKMDAIIQDLSEELEKVKANLEEEKRIREKLEVSLDDTRIAFSGERKNRLELERVQLRLRVRDLERESDVYSMLVERNRLMESVNAGLKEEEKRLEGISMVLPKDLDLEILNTPHPSEFPGYSKSKENNEHKKEHRIPSVHYDRSNVAPPQLSIYNIIHASEIREEKET